VFARLNETLIFGLPGNPVSAAVTFYLFVRTAILKMQGAAKTDLRSGFAVLSSPAKAAKERDTYLPASLDTDDNGRLIATPLRWHGSSDFVGFAKADALIFMSRGESVASGDVARIAYL
jgi:molybdopterin biosynthesis enzyme